jgi:ligand-binding sensor domain-containing protein
MKIGRLVAVVVGLSGFWVVGLEAWADGTWESFVNCNSAQAVALYQGTAWVGTAGGLVQWDTPSGIPQVHLAPEGFLDNSVAAVAVDVEGRPWIGLGTWNGGLAVLDQGRWTTWRSEDGLASEWVTCLTIDSAGRKWVGTVRGLTVLDDGGTPSDKSDDQTLTLRTADGLVNQNVNAISVDTSGRAWIATTGGVNALDPAGTLFDKADDSWTSFRTADGLLADAVYGVAIDDAGRVWFATKAGVSVLDAGGTIADPADDAWISFATDQGLPKNSSYLAIALRAGTAWIGHSKGLVALEGAATPFDRGDDVVTTFTAADGLLKSYVRAIAFDGAGTAWCAVLGGGLDEFEGGATPSDKSDDVWTPHVVDSWLPGADVLAVYADGDVAWFGTSGGLAAHEEGRVARVSVGVPLTLARDPEGAFWVGTTGGLTAFSGGATPFDPSDDILTFFTTDDGLCANYVRSVSVDADGRIWCATSVGISVLDPADTPHDKADDRWASFGKADGLAGDRTNAIAAEGDRCVWVVHESDSVSALDYGSSPFDTSDDAWALFGAGSPIGVASGYSMLVDSAGVKWFGLCPGLFAFDDGGTLADTSDDRWQRFDIGDCNPGIAIDELGRKWVATGWSGVTMLDDGGTPFDPSDDVVTTYTVADGLIDDRAQAVSVHGIVVWIGTDGGLSRLEP